MAEPSDDMQRWRREVEHQRGRLGSPFAADAELHVISVSLHDVSDPALRQSILKVPTAFSIDREHVQHLIEAGREALGGSAEFQRLRRSLIGEPMVSEATSPAGL